MPSKYHLSYYRFILNPCYTNYIRFNLNLSMGILKWH
nr:MAG TPA: hypothetical protein [Caudoviricetes sp.]